MNEEDYFSWKSLKLNSEFHIVGGFIYDGLRIFNQMKVFNEEDVFSFLYNISVGVERLEKILIIISEKNTEEHELLKKIKTHDHLKLLKIIQKRYKFNFEDKHIKFLQLLSNFYKKIRYDKLEPEGDQYKSKDILISYIREAGINIQQFLSDELNDDSIRENIGEIIGKIINDLYNKIDKEIHDQNIYTTETHSRTKACKIFLEKSYNFLNERKLMKEIIIFLIHGKKESDFFNFIKDEIKPLDFSSALIESYVNFPDSDLDKRGLIDEMNHLYEEMPEKEKRKRLDMLSLIERIESSSEEPEEN